MPSNQACKKNIFCYTGADWQLLLPGSLRTCTYSTDELIDILWGAYLAVQGCLHRCKTKLCCRGNQGHLDNIVAIQTIDKLVSQVAMYKLHFTSQYCQCICYIRHVRAPGCHFFMHLLTFAFIRRPEAEAAISLPHSLRSNSPCGGCFGYYYKYSPRANPKKCQQLKEC